MTRIWKTLIILLAFSAVLTATFWIPSTELIAGPKFARLEAGPEGVKFGIAVRWWDIMLNFPSSTTGCFDLH